MAEAGEGSDDGIEGTNDVDIINDGGGGDGEIMEGGDEEGLETKTEQETTEYTPLAGATLRGESGSDSPLTSENQSGGGAVAPRPSGRMLERPIAGEASPP